MVSEHRAAGATWAFGSLEATQSRNLDTCQYVTILEAEVPRLSCAEHGVVTAAVPWAEPESGFTQLIEALVIDWLQEASIQAVARQLGLS